MFALLLALACNPPEPPVNVADAGVELRLPPSKAFTFGPGDQIEIWVWRHDDLTVTLTIAPDGAITYPLVGKVQVAGLTYEELVTLLQGKVNEYYVDAQVQVNVKEVTNQKVLVLGEVKAPQVMQITNDLSILECLVKAGGINADARTSNVLLIRGGLDKPSLYTVNVDAIYGKGDTSQLVYLQRGDIVVVPPKTITNVERFFRRVQAILAPAVAGSAVYRNFAGGGAQGTSSSLSD
ncbi:MAG: polysaccharide export protein [Deltaproteobacteria bacterium]|nr:polysaccharide export protein [Deltaproteobacteria bacterium]